MSYLDNIFSHLEYIAHQHRAITLVNTYKGVSYSLVVGIREVSRNRGNVVLTAHSTEKISLLPSTHVELHSDLFPKPIRARVQNVDMVRRTATLHRFNYIFEEMGDRKYIRVEPDETIEAKIFSAQTHSFSAQIIDISIRGMSLRLEGEPDANEVFSKDSSVRVLFNLPLTNRPEPVSISFMTKIMYIQALDGKDVYRIGLQTWPKSEEESAIRQYIFDKQTALFQDILKKNRPT